MRLLKAVGLLVFCAPAALLAQPSHYDDRPKITVTGESVVYVQPDKIAISLGIETWDKDVQVAKQQNNDIQKRAIAAIKECGVPQKDIQTDHLSLDVRYRDSYQRQDFIGYFVRNTLSVALGDPAKVEELITKVLAAGVNHIHSIDFQTTQLKQHREQARETALRAAKEKGVKMAAVLGQKVGAPLQINENASPSWHYSSWSGWGSGRSSGMSQNVAQNIQGAGGEVSDTVALGKIGIRANVHVTFELKD